MDKPMKTETEVWLVEDNEIFSTGVQRAIDRLEGMKCGGKYQSVEQAFAALESGGKPDVILLGRAVARDGWNHGIVTSQGDGPAGTDRDPYGV